MKGIFITGFWRSGTSLLLRLLDGHPQVYAMPANGGVIAALEKIPGFLDTLKRAGSSHHLLSLFCQYPVTGFQDIVTGSIKGMSFSLNEIFYPFTFDFQVFAGELFRCVKKAKDPVDLVYGYYEAMRRAWLDCHHDPGASSYAQHRGLRIDQYPGEDPVRFIMEQVPGMVVIELVRDPVYQIGSVLKNRHVTHYSLDEAIVAWGYSYNYIRQRPREYPKRYRLIKYEDLVARPEAVMKELAAFAGIQYHPCLVRPTFNGEPWQGNSTFGKKEAIVPRQEVFLSPEEIRRICKSLDQFRRELDYPMAWGPYKALRAS